MQSLQKKFLKKMMTQDMLLRMLAKQIQNSLFSLNMVLQTNTEMSE